MYKPYKIKDINLNNIIYSGVKGTNKKYIDLSYNDPQYGEKKLMFQTCELVNNCNPVKKAAYTEFTFFLTDDSVRCASSKTKKMRLFFQQLDNKLITDCKSNMVKWFGKKMDNVKYKGILRGDNSFKIKIDESSDILITESK
ncbi:MAG: hypothetical protein Faunusvirus24_1, partial [Faunusvirus sp.]